MNDETDPTAAWPSLEHLMASVIRLMSLCATQDCPAQQRTLLHLMNYLQRHPALARTPGAAAAVEFARNTWLARCTDDRAGASTH
jgi:hypothetical protein